MSLRLLANLRLRLFCLAALAAPVSATAAFAQTAVPDGFLSEAKPARVQRNLFWNAEPFIVGIDGRNTTTGPVELSTPAIGPLLRMEGDLAAQAATRRPVELRDNGCSGAMPAGRSCTISLALPPDIGAGRYTVDVMLSGPGGGQSARTIPIHVRASPWLAGLVIALGVALGALVTDWRTAARPVTNRRIEAAGLRENARRLADASAQPAVQARAREMVRELRAIDADLIAGKDVAMPLAEREQRLEMLRRSDQLLYAAGEPQGEAADIFKPLARRLTAALDAVDWSAENVEAASKALSLELAGFQRLYDAAVAYNAVAARLSAGVTRCKAAAVQKDWADAAGLREHIFDPVTGPAPAGTTEVAKRAGDLEAATRKLADQADAIAAAALEELQAAIAERLKDAALKPPTRKTLEDLARQARALAGSAESAQAKIDRAVGLWADYDRLTPTLEGTDAAAEAAIPKILPEDSGLKYEWAVETFQPAAGASAAALRQSLRRWNWATSLVMLAGIAAIGVLVLWAPNSAWGTVQDVILAILGGAGTRLAIGTIATPGA